MTLSVSWRTVAKPIGGWLFRRLPTFIFRKYYGPRRLENEIKIRLRSAKFGTVKLVRGLEVPYFEIELEAFNMSPYLDANVTGVLTSLSAYGQGAPEMFASLDDWVGFDLPRNTSCPFHVTYWLNESQTAVVSTYVKEHLALELSVMLWAESRVGVIRPFKLLDIRNPATR
jgi:hypothetical protein